MAEPAVAPVEEMDEVAVEPAPKEETQRETMSRVWDELAEKEKAGDDDQEVKPRDEKTGRFTKTEKTPQPVVEAKGKPPEGRGRQKAQADLEEPQPRPGAKPAPTEVPPPGLGKPPAVGDVAPASFRPIARELWSKLGPEYQDLKEDIHRRESQTMALFERTKGDREVLQAMSQAIQPYSATLAAEGGNVVTALSSYLQAATIMRSGSDEQKADWVAAVIRNFNVNPELLDTKLAALYKGGPPPPNGAPPPQPVDINAAVETAVNRRMQEQYLNQEFTTQRREIDAWKVDKEFYQYQRVKNRMSALVLAAARDGEDMSFDDAYEAAIHSDPEIVKVLRQREAAAAVQASSGGRARRASVSVRTSPPNPGPVAHDGMSDAESRRMALSDAWDNVMGRG